VDANIIGNINISATNGKVALVNSFDALLGGCPIYDPHIMDFVGYGSADCSEGLKTAATLSNSTADFRKAGGVQDTDVNGDDFVSSTAPFPRRTAVIVELQPFVFRTDPVRNGLDVPRDATIDVTFTEAVTVDPAWFNLTCAGSGQHNSATFASSFGGQDQYITPNDNFIAGEQCTVTVFKDRVHDVDLNDSGPNTDTLPADYSWSFTVATGTAPPYPPSVHLTMGNPSAAGTDPLNYLMEKPEFALSYNRDLGRPNWVSWHLSDEWVGTLTRVDTFRPDPQVPPDWYRVQSFDFSGTGFDRGHMTPNADRDKETSIPINQATFLMSNMVAQAPLNNQGPWADLEAYLRTLTDPANPVEGNNEVYIVAGPAGVGGTGSLGGVTNTVANGHVTVPASTWKVALVLPKASGDDLSRVTCTTRTIAVIMPNTQTINTDWHTYLTTVDAVEALSGYDFFSNLPEPYQRCIEAGTNGNNPPLVKGNQTITFPQPADSIYGDAPFTVAATGGASGNPVTFAASGACSSSGFNGATITVLAPGSCTITASQAGSAIYNAAADVVRTFQVFDRTAPSIASVTPSVTSLWPPDKGMVPVSFSVGVTDDVDPAPSCQVIGVTSNEGSSGDWQITGATSVQLRADRLGSGNGRIYVISVRCTDASGNASTATAAVIVPHDQR
jgi:DNA/RNA endonuclease G (NUC1)